MRSRSIPSSPRCWSGFPATTTSTWSTAPTRHGWTCRRVPTKRLRQLRSVSALTALQGSRALVVDTASGRIGGTLGQVIEPYRAEIERFADKGSFRLSWRLANLWATVFPMVLPPDTEDGLGIIILNSNADTHFSFTNALGMVSYEQAKGLDIAVAQYPRACWIVALHHHVVEYPKPAKALSVRIGTALINGSWFVRRLQGLSDNAVVMHGHRHIDWIGECGGPAHRLRAVAGDGSDRRRGHLFLHPHSRGRPRRQAQAARA